MSAPRHTTRLLLPAVLLSLAYPAAAGRLDQAVQLREEPIGRPTRTLPKDRHSVRIDINSVIDIEITTGATIAPPSESADNGAKLDQATRLKAVIAGMDAWVDALNASWENATKLATLSKDDPQYNQVSVATARAQRKFFSGFKAYADALKHVQEGPERAAALRAKANELVILPQDEGMPKVLALLRDEIVWLNATMIAVSNDLGKAGTPVGLAIDARVVHKGHETPLHVPGYDSIKDGVRQPYQKIHFEPTPDEQKALSGIQEEASKLAGSLQETRSIQAGLRSVGDVWVNERFGRLKVAVEQADKALEKVRDDAETAATLTGALNGPELEILVSSAVQLGQLELQWLAAIQPGKSKLSTLRLALEQVRAAREAGNPQLALQTMLQTPSTLASVVASFQSVPADMSAQASALATLIKDQVRRLPQTAAAQLPQEVPEIATSAADLALALTTLRNVSNELSAARASISDTLAGMTAAALGPDVPLIPTRLVAIEQAANTSVDIVTVSNRDEGDFLRLRIAAYKMKKGADGNLLQDGEALDEYQRDLEITKFGASSRPGGGVAFLTRLQTPSDATGSSQRAQAAPTISWMIQYRSWPKSGQDGYSSSLIDLLRPAIGVHATTPRFGSSGTDIGIGPTVSFLNDLVFAGFGWDLNVATKPMYWSLGMRVIHFGNTLGTK